MTLLVGYKWKTRSVCNLALPSNKQEKKDVTYKLTTVRILLTILLKYDKVYVPNFQVSNANIARIMRFDAF